MKKQKPEKDGIKVVKAKIGLRVWLRSGSPPMTITKFEGTAAETVWFSSDGPKYNRFPLSCLTATPMPL